MNKLLNTHQAAEEFGVSQKTVRRWLESGSLPGVKLVGGQWRVSRATVARLTGQHEPDFRPAA